MVEVKHLAAEVVPSHQVLVHGHSDCSVMITILLASTSTAAE